MNNRIQYSLTNDLLKIKKVEFVGEYGFVRILPDVNYDRYKYEGYKLPNREDCTKGQYWINTKDVFIRLIFQNGSIFDFEIKKGYTTDFASVPRVFWSIINNDESSIIIAAIVHDIMYGTNCFTFHNANFIFLEIMKYYKMSWIKRNLAYKSVEWFGKSRYKQTNEQITEQYRYIELNRIN